MAADHDPLEGLEVGLSADGKQSVTFDQDDAVFVDAEEDSPQEEAEPPQGSATAPIVRASDTSGFSRTSSLPPRKASFVDRSAQWPRSLSVRNRGDHMSQLIQQQRKTMRKLFPVDVEEGGMEGGGSAGELEDRSMLEMHSEFVRNLKDYLEKMGDSVKKTLPAMEVRLHNVSYKVPSLGGGSGESTIHTIYNSSFLYTIQKCIKRLRTPKEDQPEKKQSVTNVLSNINLVLKPNSMYLVLGPPLSGKTSLLKAIAGMLPQGEFPAEYPEEKYLTGQILYNNLVCSGEGADEAQRTLFKNLVAFVRQNDAHAPRLTVAETFQFSGNCKDENVRNNKKGTSKDGKVGLTLEGLGLSHVQDTFVGNEQIRGVSGGQRRRVTLGEMLVFDTPLLCGDEISTGEAIMQLFLYWFLS